MRKLLFEVDLKRVVTTHNNGLLSAVLIIAKSLEQHMSSAGVNTTLQAHQQARTLQHKFGLVTRTKRTNQ